MADSARLNRIADSIPPHVGWLSTRFKTRLILNGSLLEHRLNLFPLQARVRIFEGSRPVAQAFTEPFGVDDNLSLCLNDMLGGRELENAYFEAAVFPVREECLVRGYFGELWCSVLSDDGRVAFNYPPNNSLGVATSVVTANCLYYPGVLVDTNQSAALIAVNHNESPVDYDLTLHESAGTVIFSGKFTVAAKSCQRLNVEDLADDAAFAGKAGLLVMKFDYKLNAYLQTIHRKSGTICGMDHLGFLFAHRGQDLVSVVKPETANANRLSDPVVCYCTSTPQSRIEEMLASGLNVTEIQKRYGCGTVCRGCAPLLEALCAGGAVRQESL